jgi:hypothetical protein
LSSASLTERWCSAASQKFGTRGSTLKQPEALKRELFNGNFMLISYKAGTYSKLIGRSYVFLLGGCLLVELVEGTGILLEATNA